MKYNLAIVPISLIDFVWKSIEVMLESIINKAHGEMNLITVKQKLKEDRAVLLLALNEEEIKGLAIIQLEIFDTSKRVLNISMASGELNLFTGEYDDFIVKMAKDLKCEEIRAIGARVGWERALKNTNWSAISSTLLYKLEK